MQQCVLKDADGMENSVDPDYTAPYGAVWSRSALFVQTYLPQYLHFWRSVNGHWSRAFELYHFTDIWPQGYKTRFMLN